MKRAIALVALAVLLAGCGSADLDPSDLGGQQIRVPSQTDQDTRP